MDGIQPPPPPANSNQKIAATAIWSLCLASFVWIALLILGVALILSEPADDDRTAWFLVGATCLILFATLLASVILALAVLIKRQKGATLAVIALALSILPILLFVASAIRATFKPSKDFL
jgi:membrane-bound ClpP family serine protease